MNWGQKLTIVFIIFAGGMLYLAYRCMGIDTDLVSKEYYKDELRFQEVIDGTESANALSSKVKIVEEKEMLNIQLPVEMKNATVKGNIWFYCAADAKKDRHIVLQLNTNAAQQINKEALLPGIYTVKFDWTGNNKHYYSEAPFTIL